MPDSPCHGDAQRLTPVIPAGQKPISVRLRRAVQPRHRRVSLLILKFSLLILNSSVRNSALTWSPVTESNRRPSPYHGDALPTELTGRVFSCLTWASAPPGAPLRSCTPVYGS